MGNGAILEMTVTPDFEQTMKGAPFFLEIEMLQGERTPLRDGRTLYKMIITDPDKQDLLKEFLLKMMSQSHKACKS